MRGYSQKVIAFVAELRRHADTHYPYDVLQSGIHIRRREVCAGCGVRRVTGDRADPPDEARNLMSMRGNAALILFFCLRRLPRMTGPESQGHLRGYLLRADYRITGSKLSLDAPLGRI